MSSPAPSADVEREDALGPEELRGPEGRAEVRRMRGLGHDARRPTDIPRAGWWAVLKRVWAETSSDQVSTVAASCAFYALFSVFPAISVLISLYGLLFPPQEVEAQLQALQGIVPDAAYQLISQRVHDVAATASTALSWGLAGGVLLALWSASAGTKSLMNALNVAYEEKEKRGFIRFQLTALAFTLIGITGVIVAIAVIIVVPTVLQFDLLGPWAAVTTRIVSYLLLAAFVVFGLAVTYRYAPSRSLARWRWLTPGSLLATVLWLLASLAFSFYVANFASYDATYGSLGAVIIVLMWFFISAFVVMLGAELNAELELQTRHDTTTGAERAMGDRGAFVADHVAAAGQRTRRG